MTQTCSTSICQAVTATAGTEAAPTWLDRRGFGAMRPASATAYSAWAPMKLALLTPETGRA